MFENKEGQRVPSVVFKTRADGEFVDVSSDDIFNGKTVAVFSLPGAFTPTCSSTHCHDLMNWLIPSKTTVLMKSSAYR
jgi:peroxiredoxin